MCKNADCHSLLARFPMHTLYELQFSNTTDSSKEDIIRSDSSKFTILLYPKYTVFYSCHHFFFDICHWKILHILFNTFKFISWTTVVASLMGVLLPVCPTGSGMEEKPNSASVSSSEQCGCKSFAQYHHDDYTIKVAL